MDKLKAYKDRRDFSRTDEPRGEIGEAPPRFAVQYHEATRAHFDLRLSYDGVLLSWAVPKMPSDDPHVKRLAVRVEDHPLDYADFEGTIPRGQYGGGTVLLWDEGAYVPRGDFAEGLRSGALKFTLYGQKLRGGWTLVRLQGDGDDNWLLVKERDEYANLGMEETPHGVRTGRTIAEVAADIAPRETEAPPPALCLPTAAEKLPEGEDWVYEIKYDGYRIAAHVSPKHATLYTRNGKDFTARFPRIARELGAWARQELVLDGEVVAADEKGRADFSALVSGAGEPVYVVFDILRDGDEDLRALPLEARRQKLDALLPAPLPRVRVAEQVRGQAAACMQAAETLGLEGIVAKRRSAPYRGGRSDDWRKCKCRYGGEFVVGGYTRTSARDIGAVLLGEYDDTGILKYAGRANVPFGRKQAADLRDALHAFAADSSPFSPSPRAGKDERIVWLRPALVGQVRAAGRTKGGKLRQAVFCGLREDKVAADVTGEGTETAAPEVTAEKEQNPKEKIALTHPDRIVYAEKGITKADVAAYYEAAAERLLRYGGGRIVSILRAYDGADERTFFCKHPARGGVLAPNGEGEIRRWFCFETAQDLLREVQNGGLEFHVWGSKVADLERPDMAVLDLDPDEALPLNRVREGVRGVRALLNELHLPAYLKTSGGKGYHIVVPLYVDGWEAFHEITKQIAQLLQARDPDLYTASVRLADRKGKIYVDFGRNTRGATSVAAYSLRARRGAPVSMPISWDESDAVPPDGIDIFEAVARLRLPDPWESMPIAHDAEKKGQPEKKDVRKKP